MKHPTNIYVALFFVMLSLPSGLAAQGDSLKWDFTDLFQGTKANPTLPSSLEGWKEHLEFFGKNIPQEEAVEQLLKLIEQDKQQS